MRYYGIIESIQGDEFTAGVYSISGDKIGAFTSKLGVFKGGLVPRVGAAFCRINGLTEDYYEVSLYWSWWNQRKLDTTPKTPLPDWLQKHMVDMALDAYLKDIPKGQ